MCNVSGIIRGGRIKGEMCSEEPTGTMSAANHAAGSTILQEINHDDLLFNN